MGVEFIGVVGRRQQVGRVDASRDGHDRLAFGHLFQNLLHLRLQKEAVEENDIGGAQLLHVAGAGLVEVGVSARPHEADDVHVVAANAVRGVANLAGGGDDAQAAVVFGLGRAAAGRQGQGQQNYQ